MKLLTQMTLAIVIGLLGAGTLSLIEASKSTVPAESHQALAPEPQSLPTDPLAAPLLHREFTSSCLPNKANFYRETLTFADDGTTTFVRHFYADAQCRNPSQEESVQEGRYALAEEEAGHLLLTVRNLYNEKTADVIPYFEALIKVDHDHLVMESSPSTSLHYTASTKSI